MTNLANLGHDILESTPHLTEVVHQLADSSRRPMIVRTRNEVADIRAGLNALHPEPSQGGARRLACECASVSRKAAPFCRSTGIAIQAYRPVGRCRLRQGPANLGRPAVP
jgi:hypothetical protein